jgi:hypothetical protein
MSTPCAIVIGAIIVAVAILLTNHWQLEPIDGGSVYRMNRWTGEVGVCAIDPNSFSAGSNPMAGDELVCKAK